MVKSANQATANPGDVIDYTIVVTNNSKGDATGVWVKDHAPALTTIVSCDAAGVLDATNQYVNWFVPTLAAGQSVIYTMQVKVNDDAPMNSKIVNTAKYDVTGNTTMPDPTLEPSSDTNTVETPTPQDSGKGGGGQGDGAKPAATKAVAATAKAATSAKTADVPFGAATLATLVLAGGAIYLSHRKLHQ